jgi:hypothetical protein
VLWQDTDELMSFFTGEFEPLGEGEGEGDLGLDIFSNSAEDLDALASNRSDSASDHHDPEGPRDDGSPHHSEDDRKRKRDASHGSRYECRPCPPNQVTCARGPDQCIRRKVSFKFLLLIPEPPGPPDRRKAKKRRREAEFQELKEKARRLELEKAQLLQLLANSR